MLMKDPADRYQSCEELVASIQGQPTAAPGAVRVSAAAGAMVGGRSSTPTLASPSGGVPPIVSQPTTPIDSPLVNRRATPLERRDLPRRVADRSLAMRGGSGSWAWLWLVVAVLGGGGGAFYYYKAHGFATGGETADSVSTVTDTTPLCDMMAARTPSLPRDTAASINTRSSGTATPPPIPPSTPVTPRP